MAACLVGPALGDMSDQEFEERLRAYILSHPDIILEAMEILSEREARAQQTARIAQYPDLFSEPHSLGLGPADAPITVIEFFDYKCAPCKALHAPLKAALAGHPELRVEMRHLPILSPGSERAARFALAVKHLAGQEKYEATHAALWSLHRPLQETAFAEIAAEQGLDWARHRVEMDSDAITSRIARNRQIAGDLGLRGTPAFVTPTSVQIGGTDAEALVAGWLSQ